MKRILNNLALMITTAVLSMGVVFAITGNQPVFADAKSDACQGIDLATGGGTSSCGTTSPNTGINHLVATVINILSIVVGVVAVIMIIISGFRFVLSGGDSNNTTAARNGIIYAIVGLVVVAVAQILVRFVLNRVPTG